jgi:quercetin dioxygenase-like cupin family protein
MIQYRAMKVFDWNLVEEEHLNPLLSRKVVHTENMTIARLWLRKFAVVPMHSHVNEQFTMLERGSLRFVIEGEERELRVGEMLQIPPHAAHMVEALEDSIAVDLFAPVREDWLRGDDSYLRR